MTEWRIHSPRNPDWQCHLGDCDEDHAYSVMDSLRQDPHCPDYLEIENLTPKPEPEPEPEREPPPQPVMFLEAPQSAKPLPPKQSRFWRRK